MVELAATSRVIHALGRGAEVAIETSDWQPGDHVAGFPRTVDAAVAGSAAALRVPTRAVSLIGSDGAYDTSRPQLLPDGQYLLSFADGIEGLVRFSGPARVDPDDDAVAVGFPGESQVAVGFRESRERPVTVTVPETPAGVATAVTHMAAAHRTTGPERSHPAYRDHPPLLAFGERDVPREVEDATPETGIELRLPPSYDALYVCAPLAYYLGAELVVERREAPRLVAPDADLSVQFRPMPSFQREVSALLRRVFHLDCLVRDLPFEPDDPPAVGELGLDPATLRDLAPAERLACYVESPTVTARTPLPDWHLETSMASDPENARALPYLCDRMSLVYGPESSALEGRDLLARALDDFYRGPGGTHRGTEGSRGGVGSRGEVANVDIIEPRLHASAVHGWLAEGTPIDAFKTSTRANENRLTGEAVDREALDVRVVLNDPAMDDERSVADIYRERAADLPVCVTVHESLSRAELARVFETPTDFVHYVGHCEVGGLKCADGFLPAEELSASRARTFFLNACGSYREGRALVERGSVAGGVTMTSVLNEQAATVGTAFARLLIHGFGIERALQLARRRIMMGKDYAVVGDGTFALAPCCGDPAVLWVDPEEGDDPARADRFRATYEVVCSRTAGRRYRDPFEDRERLYGTDAAATLDRAELAGFLERHSLPVVFDGEFTWSDDLLGEL